MQNGLIIAKLHAHRVSESVCYELFENRIQIVKIVGQRIQLKLISTHNGFISDMFYGWINLWMVELPIIHAILLLVKNDLF